MEWNWRRMPWREFEAAKARAERTVRFILGERPEPDEAHVENMATGAWQRLAVRKRRAKR
jgi:hypothetical protein